MDNGSYPVPAIYTFGINLTFKKEKREEMEKEKMEREKREKKKEINKLNILI